MKLQTKINIRFLILISLVFTLAGVSFYVILEMVVHQNMDEILDSRKVNISSYLLAHPMTDSVYESPDNLFVIQRAAPTVSILSYRDSTFFDAREKEQIPCRTLTFTQQVNSTNYKITIVQSLLESEDLISVIFYFMLALLLFIFIVLLFLNNWLSYNVWKPFFSTLTKLKAFKMSDSEGISFSKTGIREFDQLNETLNTLTDKIRADFINLKEFTENASHEIQTPLAIIKTKLELSLRDQTLPEQHRKYIQAAFESTTRLSKLNEALLLLSRIENRQFLEEAEVDLGELSIQRLAEIDELLALKNIQVSVHIPSSIILSMNPYLAEILINNLIGNALKHNLVNGKIRVEGENNRLVFSNTGKTMAVNPENLFKRFVKHATGSDSTGLGLAIASEICRNYNLSLEYTYDNGFHRIRLATLANTGVNILK